MEIPQFILILSGVLALIIVLVIWFYPVFHILFAKYVFGKFSARYIDVHKKYTGKSPYGYCIKDDFVNHIASFYKKKSSFQAFKSDQPVLFGKIPYGASFKEVFKENTKPFCVNSFRLEHFELKILGYRSEMFDTEMKSYYYFINNRFFMGEYTFKNPADAKLKEVALILRKKYLNGAKDDSMNFLINGANEAKLRFENTGFNLSVKYLDSSNQEINDKLDQFWNTAIKKGIDEITSDFETELFDRL
ncbi:MAG: hypothetical protein IH598_05365 [Bacteroidales bacterium]|nr:hypothetical protein [Bacteroidales bacterium]